MQHQSLCMLTLTPALTQPTAKPKPTPKPVKAAAAAAKKVKATTSTSTAKKQTAHRLFLPTG